MQIQNTNIYKYKCRQYDVLIGVKKYNIQKIENTNCNCKQYDAFIGVKNIENTMQLQAIQCLYWSEKYRK